MSNLVELNIKYENVLITKEENGCYQVDFKRKWVSEEEIKNLNNESEKLKNYKDLTIWSSNGEIIKTNKNKLQEWYSTCNQDEIKYCNIVIKESRVTEDYYLLIGGGAISKFNKFDNYLAELTIRKNKNDSEFIPNKVYDYDGSTHLFYLGYDYDKLIFEKIENGTFQYIDFIGVVFDQFEKRKVDLTIIEK